MFIGQYKITDVVRLLISTHKFETGEIFDSSLTGYYLKVNAAFEDKISVTFFPLISETGKYYCEIDTTGFVNGVYLISVDAEINGRVSSANYYFQLGASVGVYM